MTKFFLGLIAIGVATLIGAFVIVAFRPEDPLRRIGHWPDSSVTSDRRIGSAKVAGRRRAIDLWVGSAACPVSSIAGGLRGSLLRQMAQWTSQSFARTYTSRSCFWICSIRLTQWGRLFRSCWVITTVQLSSLGTIAILIDAGHSANDDSFSRKIQIRSMLEILFLANNKPSQRRRDLEWGCKAIQPRSRFNLTSQPYQ